MTDHHRFMLKTILRKINRIKSTIAELDEQIEKMVEEYNGILELLETIPGVGHGWYYC